VGYKKRGFQVERPSEPRRGEGRKRYSVQEKGPETGKRKRKGEYVSSLGAFGEQKTTSEKRKKKGELL